VFRGLKRPQVTKCVDEKFKRGQVLGGELIYEAWEVRARSPSDSAVFDIPVPRPEKKELMQASIRWVN